MELSDGPELEFGSNVEPSDNINKKLLIEQVDSKRRV
jgi:hypothetical protein